MDLCMHAASGSGRVPIRRRRGVWTLVFLLLGTGCGRFERKPEAPPPPPPEAVVLKVEPRAVTLSSTWIGGAQGLVNAQIRAKVQGYLLRQVYADGAAVKKGDLLFELDPRQFAAVLDHATAQVAQAQGKLDEAKAMLGKTEIDVTRYRPLAAEKAISQQDLDNAIQANLAAQASVAAAESAILAAKADADNASINLEFTKIVAPIDGIVGIAQVQVGDLVGPSSPPLTTITTVDPNRVFFPISEQEFLLAADKLRDLVEGRISGGQLELILTDGSVYPHRGTLVAADRQVDTRTGTITMVAEFPNPESVLRPGQYARIRAATRRLEQAIVLPQRALVEVQGAFQAVVVRPDGKVEFRDITVGEQISAAEVLVTAGLRPGETVVVEGMQRLRPDMAVTTKPWTPPAPAAGPASPGSAPGGTQEGAAGTTG